MHMKYQAWFSMQMKNQVLFQSVVCCSWDYHFCDLPMHRVSWIWVEDVHFTYGLGQVLLWTCSVTAQWIYGLVRRKGTFRNVRNAQIPTLSLARVHTYIRALASESDANSEDLIRLRILNGSLAVHISIFKGLDTMCTWLFSAITRETTFVTSCLLFCTWKFSENGSSLKLSNLLRKWLFSERKDFAHLGANSFLLE